MDENTFWRNIWLIVLAAFTVLVGSIAAYNIHSDYQVASLIREGKDPIAVKCAFGGVEGSAAGSALLCKDK